MRIESIPARTAERGWCTFLLSHPSSSFYCLTFAISWAGAFAVVAHYVLQKENIPKFTGLMMFPIMLLGPCLSSLFMTWTTGGSSGVRTLLRRLAIWRSSGLWYAVLLIPACFILTTLTVLTAFASPVYRPNFFPIGLAFGFIAGFFEEIGWTGFAFPSLYRTRSAFTSAILLGIVWSAWHMPVIDYLGTATPHGAWWLEYFLAFSFAMTAIRVLISWLFVNTGSLLLAQLMHAASTGALVVLSPPLVSAAQESAWYVAYGCLLWAIVAVVRLSSSASLTHRSFQRDKQLPVRMQ